MGEQLPVKAIPGLAIPVHRAAAGEVVYLTEDGVPVAELHPAGTAARLRAVQAGNAQTARLIALLAVAAAAVALVLSASR